MLDSTRLSTYIPLDKSWMIRMGFMDSKVQNKQYCINIIDKHPTMTGTDIKRLRDVLMSLKTASLSDSVSVGESATLYRFLKIYLLSNGIEKEVIKEGTLKDRDIFEPDSSIFSMSPEELLKLDNGTSGWASAVYMFNGGERLDNAPHKLALTYEAFDNWKQGKWSPRMDETIFRQAWDFVQNKRRWEPKHSEDFCYGYTFGYLDLEEAKERWPQLVNHESNRLEEMKKEIEAVDNGQRITSLDHRVVQAAALYAWRNHGIRPFDLQIDTESVFAISKTWPQFWTFLNKVIECEQ